MARIVKDVDEEETAEGAVPLPRKNEAAEFQAFEKELTQQKRNAACGCSRYQHSEEP